MDNKVVFIKGETGFMVQALIKNMKNADLEVTDIEANVDEIEHHQYYSGIIVYYMGGNQHSNKRILECLGDICGENKIPLCLIGDSESLYTAEQFCNPNIVSLKYARPFDVRVFVDDIKNILSLQTEYIRKKIILLVDDDMDFLQMARKWLSEQYIIDTVGSADEALIYLERKKPDLVLLDYEMPGMNGYELLSKIRSGWKTSEIPVIFLTGNDDKDSVMKILEKKPDGYMLKSTPKEQLMSVIEGFFNDYIQSKMKQK